MVVSPLFCALFTGNMTVFAKCLTLAYSSVKNSPFWMMIIIRPLVIVMICISSAFSLKMHLKSHHKHYHQNYPHHNMYGGEKRPIWPPPTPPTQRLDFEHFFMMMMMITIIKIITIAIIMKFTIFIITQ